MIKSEIVSLISQETGVSERTVMKIVNSLLSIVSDAIIKGEKVQFSGFGTFETIKRAPRKGRDAVTSSQVFIPEKRAPVFRPSDSLKNQVAER